VWFVESRGRRGEGEIRGERNGVARAVWRVVKGCHSKGRKYEEDIREGGRVGGECRGWEGLGWELGGGSRMHK